MTRGVLEEALAIYNCDRAWLVYPCDPNAPTCSVLVEHTHADYPGAFPLAPGQGWTPIQHPVNDSDRRSP
jgi:hypothetical protein